MTPTTTAAYELMHRGSIAFARCERVGIRMDVPYIHRTIKETNAHIADRENDLKQGPEWRLWVREFGGGANLNSREELGTVLFEKMGLTSHKRTATRKWSTDEESLERLDNPFCEEYVSIQKLKTPVARLEQVLREIEGDLLHNFFHLHTVETWRSSSSDMNFQNIPIRLPEQAKIIRPAFIPREGNVLSEWDFKGAEVRVGACYHKDPAMMRYIKDPTTDMHRDAAADCYILPKSEVPKDVRQEVKGDFVFATFYGSFYDSVADSLWWAIKLNKLKTKAGVGLYKHLAANGIAELGDMAALRGQRGKRQDPTPGTFLAHIKKAYDILWERRFPIYDKWRRDLFARYQRDGWFQTLTGFTVHGVYSRNYITNVPIQGSSFHCLLWCFIEIQNEMRRLGMRSQIIGQVHDSILIDGPPDELPDVFALMKDVIERRLPIHWPWLIVPMDVEVGACEVGGSWHSKKEIKW